MVDERRLRNETRTTFNDPNSKIATLVKLITNYGPQINRISRELGVHKETARYWYKEKLVKRGYTVQAVPNHERLGLKRTVVLAEFSETFRPYADPILMAMSELSYLSSFMKTLPDDLYSIQASVPEQHLGDWVGFMLALKQRGLFSSVRVFPFEWVRVVPMRAEMYDFDNGAWQFDWASKPRVDPGSSDFYPSPKGKFDLIDLQLIEQLQIDPDASLAEAGARLRLNYKTLTWHYRNHILGHGLLKGYLINWAGTRYDSTIEKAMQRRHRYMWLELLVKDITESERMELIAKTSRIPFVWLEAGGQNYFAQIAFPLDMMTEGMEFIREVVAPIKQKASWHLMDQANALRFSLIPSLFDAAKKSWQFDQADLLNRFDRLVLQIKGTTS